MAGLSQERRDRLTRRGLPALAAGVLLLVLVVGVIAGGGTSDQVAGARKFAAAWERGDHAAMHSLLTDPTRRRYAPAILASSYRRAAATMTLERVVTGSPRDADGGAVVPATLHTRVFGRIRGELRLRMDGERVSWSPRLVFPALRRGELLTRRSEPPRRATIQDREGQTIVSGPAGSRSPSPAGSAIAGEVGPGRTPAERDAVYARGFPHRWPVGRGGLEAILEERVAGRPGGTLLAGPRVVERAEPRAGRPIRTTIDLKLEAAAQAALAGRFGGIAAVDARSGRIRALAGVAFSAPQPPGSTFKIVTLAAALEDRVAKTSTRYPVATHTLIDGVRLENANGESCGGTLEESFVHSCNSVFAPLGVKVGAERLVEMAERFGWNRPVPLRGARTSTLPAAGAIGSELALGSTAIGQGRVLATPLQLAMVAQTIAADGIQATPTVLPGGFPRGRRVVGKRTARTIRELMQGVVARGTGTAAALGSGVVAGKTGTAELESTTGPTADTTSAASKTDAWFTAFAPARRPRIAVAVMLVRAGAGGETAAPAARTVLQAALGD